MADMQFHVRARAAVALALTIGAVLIGSALIGTSAFAASSADLSITLTNKATAEPGKRVTFDVVVRNAGPDAAANVQIDFLTSESMSSIVWTVPGGHCYFSPKETACRMGTIKVGGSGHATISGVLSAKLAKGTQVTNLVTMTSDTPLVHASPAATDDIKIGIAGSVAAAPSPTPSLSLAPLPTPSPSASVAAAPAAATGNGLISQTGVAVSIAAIVAAVVWFAVGDVIRSSRRGRRRAR
jgi:uncharacterized repeat protein (TIGR01451 family)